MSITLKDIGQSALNQDGQTTYMEFALLAEAEAGEYINVTPLMRCRDYFNDIVYIQYTKMEDFPRTYGFTWKYQEWLSKQIKEEEYTDMLVLVDPKNKQIDINFKLINRLEKRLGFSPTTYEDIKYSSWDDIRYIDLRALLVKVPVDWWANSPLLSLYTLLWRLIGGHTLPEEDLPLEEVLSLLKDSCAGTTDLGLIKNLLANKEHLTYFLDNWRSFIGYTPQPFIKGDEEDDADEEERLSLMIHNGTGIQSMIVGMSMPDCAEPAVKPWCLAYEEERKSEEV